ncbi:MAG: DUF2085 domain-containing protein [Methanomassiliicoccales archaeon]
METQAMFTMRSARIKERWYSLTWVKKVQWTLLIIFSTWLAVVLLSPFTLPSGSVQDLSGSVGSIDNQETLQRMNPLARAVYTAGDTYCHQISDRSYFLNGNQMPFCARDLGIFVGLVAGISLGLVFQVRIGVLAFLLGMAPMVIDGGLQLFLDYQSTNPLRTSTGLMAGTVISLAFGQFAAGLGPGRRRILKGRVKPEK